MHNNSYQKISVILSIIFAVIFGLCFSYRSWQFCCVSFSNWSLLNPISFLSFFESFLFAFILFFILSTSRFNVVLKLFYISYTLAVILLDSPYRFYFTALVLIFAVCHALYFFAVEKKQKVDVLIFAFFLLITFIFFPWTSPFHFDEKFVADFRVINSNLIVIQPLYKGFIAAKFLNFSAIDYSYYASAVSTPVGNSTFLIQILSYIFDLPSISTKSFFYLIDILSLILFASGAFCTYILFKKYLKASTVISMAAAMLLFPLNKILINLYVVDNWLVITCYAIIPLAIIGGIRIINGEKNSILICAFILSLPFVLMSVHPNYYIIFVISFLAIITFIAAEQSSNHQDFFIKIKNIFLALAISLLFSAHYLLPIIKQHLVWDCHAIPHYTAHCYRHCNREILMALLAFFYTVYLSFRNKKIVIGLYFTAPLLLVCYLMKKTFLMDFIMVKISGGMNDRFILLLWFLLCFIMLYYLRNLRHKIANFVLIIFSVFVLSYFTYKYSPSFSSLLKEKQSYHVFLKTELANYPALLADKSNANYIKNKIAEYEKDFSGDSSYKLYEEKLKKFAVQNIAEVNSPEKIIEIAAETVDLIDDSYAGKIHNIDEKKFRAAISTYNTSLIYYGLEPFARIESSTGHDFHIGSGPGLLINNASTSFDPRYMVGYIPAEFLYITKNYDDVYYKGRGGDIAYNSLPWLNFDPKHPKTKHMMNVSGVDYIASDKNFTDLRKLRSFNLFGSTYHLYQNPSSYGVSYIANVKDNVAQEDVSKIKNTVKNYLNDKITYKNYEDVMKKYETSVFKMKNKYDALVVGNDDLKNNSGSGKSAIKNIIGNIVIVESNCQNKDCISVLNFAHFPQWKAFSPSFTQYKIYDVNYAFMGVRTAPGENKIMFVYLSYFNEAFVILPLLMVLLMLFWSKFYFKKCHY